MNPARPLILAVAISLLPACSGGSDTPAFNPAVSMNANIGSESITNYTAEYNAIYAAGARGAQTAAPWSSLETTPDPLPVTGPTYDLTMIDNTYFGLNALAGYGFTSILINIPIIAIDARKMPADIATLPFNDTTVIDRYRLLLDQVLPYLNDSNVQYYVSLGNEVDTYFSTHDTEWPAYKDLIEDARTYIHAHALYPNIKVGVTTTFDGATSPSSTANVASLNANMDVVILTYYPIASSTFVPRDPLTVFSDMAAMTRITGGKPLVMQEWGYPSSSVLSSTEQMQADFIANTFSSWRQYGSGRIPFISFFKRRDWDQTYCETLSTQTSPGHFYEFLCSLGLRTNADAPKLAYPVLTTEISNIGP